MYPQPQNIAPDACSDGEPAFHCCGMLNSPARPYFARRTLIQPRAIIGRRMAFLNTIRQSHLLCILEASQYSAIRTVRDSVSGCDDQSLGRSRAHPRRLKAIHVAADFVTVIGYCPLSRSQKIMSL